MTQGHASEKTNPTPNPPKPLPSDAAVLREIAACAGLDFSPRPARSKAHRQTTQCIRTHPSVPPQRSKPPVPQTPELTTRQLAAARLLVQGRSSADVAKRIGTLRQTINRWKKLPTFVAEIQRMHEILLLNSR